MGMVIGRMRPDLAIAIGRRVGNLIFLVAKVDGPSPGRETGESPSRGKRTMMRMTTPPCTSRPAARLASLALALVPLVLVGGCSSWSSVGQRRTPLTGMFWHRQDSQEKEP